MERKCPNDAALQGKTGRPGQSIRAVFFAALILRHARKRPKEFLMSLHLY